MKSLFCACCTVLCSIVTMTCAVEVSQIAEERQTDPGATAGVQDVSSELILNQVTPAACGGSTVRVTHTYPDGCTVVMTCHDSRTSCRPSFCGNGQCGGTARSKAMGLCTNNCASVDCGVNNLQQLPQGC
jgi:hypothetical protein